MITNKFAVLNLSLMGLLCNPFIFFTAYIEDKAMLQLLSDHGIQSSSFFLLQILSLLIGGLLGFKVSHKYQVREYVLKKIHSLLMLNEQTLEDAKNHFFFKYCDLFWTSACLVLCFWNDFIFSFFSELQSLETLVSLLGLHASVVSKLIKIVTALTFDCVTKRRIF